jgi:hypothetical protein
MIHDRCVVSCTEQPPSFRELMDCHRIVRIDALDPQSREQLSVDSLDQLIYV